MKKFWLAAGAFCACFAVFGEVIRLPLSNAAIKIDGKINAAEWRCGSMQYGTRRYDAKRLTDRQATFFLARDSKNIYFACRSELPPKGEKLLSRVRKDGLMVTMDDTVELHLYPPRGKYVYQIIINGRKAKYCAKCITKALFNGGA